MSAPALVHPAIAAAWRSRRGVALVLGVGAAVLGLLFNVEIASAIHTWMDSTAYNHCFLVIPIAAYLAWDRRDRLQRSRRGADAGGGAWRYSTGCSRGWWPSALVSWRVASSSRSRSSNC